MKRKMVAAALATALLFGAAPAHASELVEPTTVAESVALDPNKAINILTPDLWEDIEAKPGDIVHIPYQAPETTRTSP